MNGYPRDMFDEMDEIFDHLFARMQDNRMAESPQVTGFRIVIDNGNLHQPVQNSLEIPSRTATNPVAEVHRLDNEVKVIAELPGAAKESIRLDVQDETLSIDADGVGTQYHTTAKLPAVDCGSMQSTFRNGVLEVTFRILPEEPGPA